MPEKLQITCVCGYENWVSPDHLGETIECMMCGADLAVDEASATGHFTAADAGEFGEDEPAPESPTNPPHRQPSPPDGVTLEERVEAQRRQRGRPLSPFDADEGEQEPPRPRESEPRAAVASPQPKPRVRNPFEADEPEPEKPSGAGRFTLTPQSSAKGGRSYSQIMDEVRPKERRDRNVTVQTISPHDAPSGEKCSQCGRELRGTWDRIETEKGVICYVCSNQAVHGVPERLKVEKPERRELSERDLITGPVQELPIADEPWYKDPESPEFKRVVWFLAVFTLLLGGYFFFFGGDAQSPAVPDATEAADSSQVGRTPLAGAMQQGWLILSFIISLFIAIYAALRIDNETPHGKLLPDFLFIGAVCVPAAVFYFIVGAAAMLIENVPAAGPILAILLRTGRWLAIIAGVTRFVRMKFSQFVIAAVIYFVLSAFVFQALGRALGIM